MNKYRNEEYMEKEFTGDDNNFDGINVEDIIKEFGQDKRIEIDSTVQSMKNDKQIFAPIGSKLKVLL